MITDSWQDVIVALRQAVMVDLEQMSDIPDGGEYRRLSDSRSVLLQEQRHLKDELEAVRAFERDANGYSREATEQRSRLVSIGVFDDVAPAHSCPLCEQALSERSLQPEISALRGALQVVTSRLEGVVQNSPRIERAASDVAIRLDKVHAALTANRQQLEAVRTANEPVRLAHDELARRALVQGRISLYLMYRNFKK